jgi:hypothetical protein
MAKNIIVSLDGEESSFGFKAVDRASLYGKRRRIALDKDGNPCTRGSLLEDGSLLLSKGVVEFGILFLAFVYYYSLLFISCSIELKKAIVMKNMGQF